MRRAVDSGTRAPGARATCAGVPWSFAASTRRASRLASFTVGVALLAPSGASAATRCPFADARPDDVGIARTTAALRCLVDHERAAAGLPAHVDDRRLALVARRHAVDMGRRAYFADTAPPPAPHGATLGERLATAEYPSAVFSEDIARSQPTPRAVVKDWLAGRGTCGNLLAQTFADAGAGAAALRGGPYWVLVLGRPVGTPAPGGPVADCPRLPAVPAPSGDPAPVAVAARRSRRTLVVRVTIPPEIGRSTLVVRVQQRGRAVRTLRRRTAPTTRRFSISLADARAGRVLVQAGPTRRVSVAFR